MDKITAILETLATPALFWKDGKVLKCNSACEKLHLKPGDALTLPTELSWDTAAQFKLELDGRVWNAGAKPVEGEVFLSLTPEQEAADADMLATTARSLRDPLTSLLSGCSALFPQLEEFENEEIQLKASAITRSFFRLLRVNTLLRDTWRLTTNQPLFVQKTDIKAFFEEQVMVWTDALLDGGIRLEYQGPQKAFKGNIDRYLLSCAVLQLLSNAAIYRHADTPVRLSVSYMRGRVKIRVENQGDPIPPDVFSTVFSRHRELPEVGDSRWGSGLGLHLVQLVAKAHGGTVMIQSEDGGTAVTMVLDLDTPATDVNTPFVDLTAGYDPSLVVLSDVLPAQTYDSRNIEV